MPLFHDLNRNSIQARIDHTRLIPYLIKARFDPTGEIIIEEDPVSTIEFKWLVPHYLPMSNGKFCFRVENRDKNEWAEWNEELEKWDYCPNP